MTWSFGRPDVRCNTPKLMTEDEDLEVLGVLVAAVLAATDYDGDEGTGDQVEEGQHRPIVPGRSDRESGFPTPTGSIQAPRSPRPCTPATSATTRSRPRRQQ
jgi:hypothetical protein